MEPISFNGAAQKLSWGQNMFLTNEFLERTGAHSGGEWRSAIRFFNVFALGFAEQIVHEKIYDDGTHGACNFRGRKLARVALSVISPTMHKCV